MHIVDFLQHVSGLNYNKFVALPDLNLYHDIGTWHIPVIYTYLHVLVKNL